MEQEQATLGVKQTNPGKEAHTKRHTVIKRPEDFDDFARVEIWEAVAPLHIDTYLWMENGYTPTVSVRIFHTNRNIYLYFHVPERKITVRHTAFGSPVYKDSCVEFFLNPFPEHSDDYFNMEFNALGTMLIGVGRDGDDTRRHYLNEKEAEGFETISSVKHPLNGDHGSDHWKLFVRVPKTVFEKHYRAVFTDKATVGNFYKCGDETEYEHYGAWNRVVSETPNFHLPQYFGEVVFAP